MCYDVSFKTDVTKLSDYIPSLHVPPETDFQDREHVMAQAFSKYPIIVLEDGGYNLHMFEWGLIAGYMNTPDKIKKSRSFMCNAQGEK